jgi:hypothetical protein
VTSDRILALLEKERPGVVIVDRRIEKLTADNVEIATEAVIGAGVIGNIKAGEKVFGTPARGHRDDAAD